MIQVSVIVPCYNEQPTIRLLLDALYQQTFPRSEMEVVIADGMSEDGTRAEIEAWQAENPELTVRVVDNQKRSIPSGLNQAIEAAEGAFIVRLDAHSMPNLDYVERSIAALKIGNGDNVGGAWRIQPGGNGEVAKSIAVAAAHPLGVGGAQYRVGGQAQAVDTVPFGAFRKEIFDRVGFFDETLLSNEDYEYNARIRKAGGVVWFDPKIQSVYFARSTFKDLARQYWRYGYWKSQMLRRYPETIRWRQGLPPLFVLSVLGLGLLSLGFEWARGLLLIETLVYGLVLLLAGLQVAIRHRDLRLLIGVPLAIFTMHFSWGLAFIWSLMITILGRTG
jgi:cellulose synthase/poly-beta-1,6-N-acetylglucosamine synthase-like glycosyltransferase